MTEKREAIWSNLFDQRENIKKFFGLRYYTLDRIINLVIILGFPIMFIVEKLLFSEVKNPFYLRVAIAFAVLFVFVLSYSKEIVRKHYGWINISIMYLVMGLLTLLAYLNNFDFYTCVLLLGTTIVFSQFFRSRILLFGFQFVFFIVVVSSILITKSPGINVPAFILLFAFINFISFWLQDYIFRQHDKIAHAENNLRHSIGMLEQLAYVVSHDLQEPVRMATSYAQLLSREYKDKLGKDGDDFISYILSSTRTLQSQVQNFLKFSRVSRSNMNVHDINLNEIMDSVLDNLQPLIRKHSAKIYYSKLPVVEGDRRQINILFEYLLTNSILYCDKKNPEIDIDYLKKDNVWEFSIKDNGIGVEERNHEKIFDVFFRTYQMEGVEGEGIGLAICRKIVLNHNGDIRVESNQAEGSIFYFQISRKTLILG